MRSSQRQFIGMLTSGLVAASVTLGLIGCGGAGESGPASCGLCGDMADLTGSITSLANGQSQMQGWVVATIERDTGIARVGEVDNAGIYQLGHVRTAQPQTIAVFSPDYILLSVLSSPGPVAGSIKQFFNPTSAYLPRLISQGPIVTFQTLEGITMTSDLAADTDGDGVPDGSSSVGSVSTSLSLTAAASTDFDMDGIPNDQDADIDGDGIVNWLDPDDDGDGILDAFDADANDNLVNDSAETNGDLYFKEGVEYIVVQYEMKPKDDGSGTETTLTFTTKVRDNVTPDLVQIRGAPSLLNGASISGIKEDGTVGTVAWNGLLGDDGESNDSSPDDRIFAKKITLAKGATPRAQETIFFELGFDTASGSPWYIDFPFSFPNVKPASISTSYDKNLKTVRLIGNPFGAEQGFQWTVNIFDEDGKLFWFSPPIQGTSPRYFALPDNILKDGVSYKYSAVAQVLARVNGFPAYSIHSTQKDLK